MKTPQAILIGLSLIAAAIFFKDTTMTMADAFTWFDMDPFYVPSTICVLLFFAIGAYRGYTHPHYFGKQAEAVKFGLEEPTPLHLAHNTLYSGGASAFVGWIIGMFLTPLMAIVEWFL